MKNKLTKSDEKRLADFIVIADVNQGIAKVTHRRHMNSIHRRETRLGRWAPVVFYALIVLSWLIEGVLAGLGERLWLVLVTLPALGLYLWRTYQRS